MAFSYTSEGSSGFRGTALTCIVASEAGQIRQDVHLAAAVARAERWPARLESRRLAVKEGGRRVA
jgi:hypothetical protein